MIKVSPEARDQVVQMMQQDGVDSQSHFVRVGVKSGGYLKNVKKNFTYPHLWIWKLNMNLNY